MSNLIEAIAAATRFRHTFNEGDEIDEESGFTADHLSALIECASTCADTNPPDLVPVPDYPGKLQP